MPNKKAKGNASKGQTVTATEVSQMAPPSSIPAEPSATSAATSVPQTSTPPVLPEDFWTKNARAKALIMSTLVPGSEAWKIAEPIELASNIMTALEDKYAPKDANGKPLRGKDLEAWDREDKRVREQARKHPVPVEEIYGDSDVVVGGSVDGAAGSVYRDAAIESQAQSHAQPETTDLDLAIPATFDLPASTRAAEHNQPSGPQSSPHPTHWTHQPVKHDSYISESQATLFADEDPDRKMQIQAALTKVLMQKLPTPEHRLVWAVLYGGETAPWPGSCSVAIPGTTYAAWMGMRYEVEWDRRAETG